MRQGYPRIEGRRSYLSKRVRSEYIRTICVSLAHDTLVAPITPFLRRSPFRSTTPLGRTSIGTRRPCMFFSRYSRYITQIQGSPQRGLNGRETHWPRGKVLGGTRCVSLLDSLSSHWFIHRELSSSTNALIYHRCSPSGEHT